VDYKMERRRTEHPSGDEEIYQLFREARARRRELELAKRGRLSRRLRLIVGWLPAILSDSIVAAGLGMATAPQTEKALR
jgi:hypothetical protein